MGSRHGTLALKGGRPINTKTFEWSHAIGAEEKAAVLEVLDSGTLSGFVANAGPAFLGGPRVRDLEKAWADHFGVRHAVSVNSATSALYAAVGAVGISAGDEVIVPPYTMSATVAAVLGYQGIPVFADVEEDCFCLDVKSVEARITPRTRAVIAVNLFGQPADLPALADLCRRRGLVLLEDNAQSPGGRNGGRYTATFGKAGIFSLNCHKAIQCGEGGIAVTDDDEVAQRMRLIRNHAEVVVDQMGYGNLHNMLGHNFRMTEIEAAIARAQLAKLDAVNRRKQELAARFDEKLGKFPFLRVPKVRAGCEHVYYLYVMRYLPGVLGVPRAAFLQALNAEGYGAVGGYVKPIYRLPVFREKRLFGAMPFSLAGTEPDYSPSLCPVTERLQDHELMYPNLIRYRITAEDVDRFADAVEKVADHAAELRG